MTAVTPARPEEPPRPSLGGSPEPGAPPRPIDAPAACFSWKHLLPREHGAWVLFTMAIVIGLGTARPLGPDAALAAALALAALLGSSVVREMITSRSMRDGRTSTLLLALPLVLGALLLAGALAVRGRFLSLLVLGSGGALCIPVLSSRGRFERRIAEVVGGLGAVSPLLAIRAAASGDISALDLGLLGLASAYTVARLLAVREALRGSRGLAPRVGLGVLAPLVVATSGLPLAAALAAAPGVVPAVRGNPSACGRREALLATLFTAAVLAAFRLGFLG